MLKETPKKLTPHDVTFGIGRIATEEEIKEYLSRPVGEFTDSKKVLQDAKDHLKARRNKRKAS
jgi:hypothetical protein